MTVVIAGATSAIGREIAAVLGQRGTPLLLLARREEEAADIAADQKVRHGSPVESGELDVRNFDASALAERLRRITDFTGFIHCVGYLGDSVQAESDPEEHARIGDVNFTGSARVIDIAAAHLRDHGGGYICALSSVAGDRPRRRVRAYGVAKAQLNNHLAALQADLTDRVRVITVKLGPVDTRMPYGRRPQPFTLSPQVAARDIVRAIDRGVPGPVYVPARWRAIMAVIKAIPSPIYDRLDL